MKEKKMRKRDGKKEQTEKIIYVTNRQNPHQNKRKEKHIWIFIRFCE